MLRHDQGTLPLPRPRAFAEDRAIEAAMLHFWQHGYAATSVRDLGAAMGLGPASLYNAFGTKRALFLRALERYVDQGLRPRVARLAAMPDARGAIATFLDDIIARSLADPQRRGCLLVNTALEVAPHDKGIGTYVAARLAEVEAFFAGRVRDAQAQGRADTLRDAGDAGRMLLATVMGLRVFARVRPEPDLLHGVARQALAALDPPLETAR